MENTRYDLEDRLLNYAAQIIRLVEHLPPTRAGNHVAGQLLRSGTSPLPNHGEAQAAESPSDFVHKLSVCLKELRESHRWLRLIQRVPLLNPASQIDPVLIETEELIKIFVASIRTAKKRKIENGLNIEHPTLNLNRRTHYAGGTESTWSRRIDHRGRNRRLVEGGGRLRQAG